MSGSTCAEPYVNGSNGIAARKRIGFTKTLLTPATQDDGLTATDRSFDIRKKKGKKDKPQTKKNRICTKRRGRPPKHGLSGTPTYKSCDNARQRCCNPNHVHYANYGGRGIRWSLSVEQVVAEIGEKPSEMTLDRIDPNGNYEPGNIAWATRQEQARNRNSNHRVEYDGRNLTIVEWSEETDIPETTIASRLKRGWSPERALTQPIDEKSPKDYRRERGIRNFKEALRDEMVIIYNSKLVAWHEHVAMHGIPPQNMESSWWNVSYAFESFDYVDFDDDDHPFNKMGFPPPPMTRAQADEVWNEIEQEYEASVTASLEDAAEREKVRAEQGDKNAERILVDLENRIADRKLAQDKRTSQSSADSLIEPSNLEAARSKAALKVLRKATEGSWLGFHDYLEALSHVNRARLEITTPAFPTMWNR